MSDEILRFGICADTQYCDIDDGTAFEKENIRRYRQSINIFEQAVDKFHEQNITYCIHLGDLIDGKCAKHGIEDICLERMIKVMKKYDEQKWHIVFGNHEFYNFKRDRIYELLPDYIKASGLCSSVKLYYDYYPCAKIRFIVLDPFEISTMAGTSEKHTHSAKVLLSSKNKNLDIPNSDWSDGLPVEDHKYVPYNGSLSDEQLDWLKDTLEDAAMKDDICFIFTHVPIYPGAGRPSGLVWNHDEVLSIIHRNGKRIAAVISGHDHNGGYGRDEKGIHHIIPPAPLECDVGQVAFGYINVFADHFDLKWYGRLPRTSEAFLPSTMSIQRDYDS